MSLCPFHHSPRGVCCQASLGVVVPADVLKRCRDALLEVQPDLANELSIALNEVYA